MRLFPCVLSLGLLAAACDRRVPEPTGQPSSPATTPTSKATAATTPARPVAPVAPAEPPAPFARAAAEHIVAIGDLHGDLDITRKALKLAGAINDQDHWSGGSLVLVQTGDLIDRGDEDRAVLDLFERLQGEAKAAGGALILLNGNHELMNSQFDFRYVTRPSFHSFDDQHGPIAVDSPALRSLTPSERGRATAFAPGGPYARKFAEHLVTVKVGKTVFVHGGILPEHVTYGIDRLNGETSAWLRAERPQPPSVVVGETGAVWARIYSDTSSPPDCARLAQALTALDAERMVVGHTPQRQGINAACDGKVWRIDTGLSHHYGGPLQVLAIDKNVPSVRKPAG